MESILTELKNVCKSLKYGNQCLYVLSQIENTTNTCTFISYCSDLIRLTGNDYRVKRLIEHLSFSFHLAYNKNNIKK